MKRVLFFPIFLIAIFTACKKQDIVHELPLNPYKDEFVKCNCTSTVKETDEYIKAEINGIPICADVKGNFGYEPFGNMLKYGNIIRSTGTTYYDNLYMIRFTNDGNFMLAIFLENSHALSKQYPYQLPRENPEYCEIGEFQLRNEKKISPDMCFFCPENNWHFYAPFFTNRLTLFADRFENNIFEGRFSGTVYTGSGRMATVKNGMFRIRLTLVPEDVIIP